MTVVAVDDDGDPVGGDSNTVTVDIVAVAAVPLTLLKVATTPTLDEPGGTFEFALAITNGSVADIASIASITDDQAGPVTTCFDAGLNPIAPPFDLAPGEVANCTFSVRSPGDRRG